MQPVQDVVPGTLVLVQESDAAFSSHKWNLARVTAVYPGPDGRVRVVDIKTPQGKVYRRPIARLAPLPVHHASTNDERRIASALPTDSEAPPPGICSGENGISPEKD